MITAFKLFVDRAVNYQVRVVFRNNHVVQTPATVTPSHVVTSRSPKAKLSLCRVEVSKSVKEPHVKEILK